MSVENDPGFWRWVVGGIVGGAGAVWGAFKYIDGRFDKKADKHAVANTLQEVKTEIALHRQTTREDIRRLYQNAEADRKLVRDGFDQLSREIHETHITLLGRMDGK